MSTLKYDHTDIGFCRVYYTWKNSKNQKIHYCAQDETSFGRVKVSFYRCTQELEPDYHVKPLEAPPLSPGDSETDKIINKWIAETWEVL